jgi:hypothetical protein
LPAILNEALAGRNNIILAFSSYAYMGYTYSTADTMKHVSKVASKQCEENCGFIVKVREETFW